MNDKTALLIAKEETTRVEYEQTVRLLQEPLFQALVVYVIVEALQRYSDFGENMGTLLEAGTLLRLIDFSAVAKVIPGLIAAVK